jgi:hypothetical protein
LGFWFFLTQSKQTAQAVANEKVFCEGLDISKWEEKIGVAGTAAYLTKV